MLSVGVTVLEPDQVGFVLVVPRTGECRINGEAATSPTLYFHGAQGGIHIRGAGRDVFTVVIRRERFRQAVAAFQGRDSERFSQQNRRLAIAPADIERLHLCLKTMLEPSYQAFPQAPHAQERRDGEDEIFWACVDSYLAARPDTSSRSDRGVAPESIVRKAEERFLAAEGSPVSLADLCIATDVSKSSLYCAFERVYGVPPLRYFNRRRLMEARLLLLNSRESRSAVKMAALAVGFTEFGRFSVEYRKLFGESPSATLNRRRNQVGFGSASGRVPSDAS
jgi:AraC-like DNA-binding protein